MLVLSLKLSSGKNGHLLNLLLFENNFEKSSLIHKDHNKVQLHITFQVCLRIRSVWICEYVSLLPGVYNT